MEKKELYPWQKRCLDLWFANHCRGIVQAATGTGKTLLALTAASRLDNAFGQKLLVKIVVPTSALMRQWNRNLQEFFAAAQDSTPEAEFQAEPYAARRDEAFSGANFQAGMHDSEYEKTAPGINSRTVLHGRGYEKTAPGINSRTVLHDSGHATKFRAGMCGGGFRTEKNYKYMIYVINSARYELARQILSDLRSGAPVLLIADECHRYESEQNRLIFEFLPHMNEYRDHFFSLGLTATLPSGHSQDYLTSVLGRKIYSYGISQASALQNVCPCDIFHVGLSFQPEEQAEYLEITDKMSILYSRLTSVHPGLKHGSLKEQFELLRILAGDKNPKTAQEASSYMNLTYRRKSLVCLASSRIFCAYDLILRLPETEKILIFGERIRQAEELYAHLHRRYPGKVGRCHSRMGQTANRNALNRFRTGEFRILISCRSLDEGVDIPDASIGIILSGTSMQRQRIQRLGRIIRKKDGKERASLYYLHIEQSVEDRYFLPDAGSFRYLEMNYSSEARGFENPRYDAAASSLLETMKRKGADDKTMAEIQRCLHLGIVRSDWQSDHEQIERKIREAENIREKNYWICMKKIAG